MSKLWCWYKQWQKIDTKIFNCGRVMILFFVQGLLTKNDIDNKIMAGLNMFKRRIFNSSFFVLYFEYKICYNFLNFYGELYGYSI